MRRALVLVALLLLVATPAAHGQANPFGTPAPAPTATPAGTTEDTSDRTLLLIAGGVLVVFIGIGWFITRDARSNLTAEDRRAVERGEPATRLDDDERGVGAVVGKQKSKRRQAGKRQRQARKANRPRRR